MSYLETALEQLSAARICGYHPGGPAAAEPTALAALALLAHQRDDAARRHVERLLELQREDGSVGIEREQLSPGWPTGLAVLAWRAAQRSSIFDVEYVRATDRGTRWLLSTQGTLVETADWLGHDARIDGWPWVAGTHAWVEPTAFALLALKHTRFAGHARARAAVLLLVNRMLASGGCNYGNTVVFGQALRPHVQPTGISLLALAGEPDASGRIARSIDYLRRDVSDKTATASLCYALLGLAAQGTAPRQADTWLAAAAERTLARDASNYKLALVALAALGGDCPLIPGTATFETVAQPN